MKGHEIQRTEIMQFRATPQEKALIEKYARKEGMTVSDYVRATLITEMAIIQQDVEAMKIVFGALGRKFTQAVSKKYKRLIGEEAASADSQ